MTGVIVLTGGSVLAGSLNDNQLKEYSNNGVLFYDPCSSGTNSNTSKDSSSCVGTLSGKTNEEKIWNALVGSNVEGVSNNPAAIAGIMGNMKQESNFDPFAVTNDKYYGLSQAEKADMKAIDDAGLGQYWGKGDTAPDDAIKQAIDLEIEWLTKKDERFLGNEGWKDKGFLNFLKDLTANTPEAYSDLFLVTVEGAYTDNENSSMEGVNNKLEEKAAIDAAKKIDGDKKYYQEASKRREYAKEIYDKYSDSGACLSGIPAFNGKEVTWQDLNPLSSNDRLALLTETYGPFAMQLQKYYGIPWELPFAVMVFESQVGAGDPGDISHQAQADGNYNMMGLTDTVVGYDDKYRIDPRVCYYNSDGQCHSGYASISQMLLGYAIYHGRSGFGGDQSYDGGLKALSPDNYDLSAALKGLMYSYCGSTESGSYCGDGGPIPKIIRTGSAEWSGLLDTVKKNGWKNSEELAKAWNIQPGGLATQQWGWGDIRGKIWDAYGAAGLPPNASATTGSVPVDSGDTKTDKNNSGTNNNTGTNNTNNSNTGTGTSNSNTSPSSLAGNAVLHKPQNEWLENAGLEGYIKDAVPPEGANGARIDTSASKGNTYNDFASDAGAGSGLPGFIILHLTSASNFDARSWQNYCGPDMGLSFYCPPHFTIDVKKREIFQHFPLTHPSAAVSNRGGMSPDKYGIQIEIVGHGGDPNGGDYATCMPGSCDSEHDYKNFTEEDYKYIASLLIAISNETGIPLESTVTWATNSHEAEGLKIQSDDELKKYIGVLGHTHINGKWDPLDIWKYIEPALSGAGYSYNTKDVSNAINCGKSGPTQFGSGECRLVPSNNGGCTEDNFTWYMQGGTADWADIPYGNCGEGSRMGSTACGPSALAMIITALTGKMVTPDVVMRQAVDAGARVCGGGTDVTKLGPVAAQYGLQFQSVSDSEVTEQSVNKWLDEGKMMIFSVGPYETEHGALTSGGHVIAIRGRASDGKWLTFNSAGGSAAGERSSWHFKPSDLLNAYKEHGRNNFSLVYK